MNAQPLAVSLNPRIKDKPAVWQKEYADNWRSSEIPLSDLRDAIGSGCAFIAAAMSSTHRSSEAFVHADLAVVDIDHGLDLESFHEHLLARRACLLYTSSSHQGESGKHRFRVLFRLPRRITDPDVYRAVVTALIRALGGDESCKDPCRLFYGNSRAEFWVNPNPEAGLDESFVTDAHIEWKRQRSSREQGNEDYDDISLGQAAYVLDEVLEPTADGERDHFIRVTAAAASAGDALFANWSDWASRGHHGTGKNRKQTSERFFRGFSGKSSLATLFYLASEQDPRWRDELPDALRNSDYASSKLPPGYRMEDFMGHNDPEYDLPKTGKRRTPSILEWAAAHVAESSATTTEAAPEPVKPRPEDEDVGPEFLGDPYEPLYVSDGPLPPEPKRKTPGKKGAKGKGQSTGSDSKRAREKVQALFPDLRYNRLTQEVEIGPKHAPMLFEEADSAYLDISEDEDKTFAKTLVYDTVMKLARRNSYNPVHDFLDQAARSEPIDYFETIAQTLLGVPEEGPDNPRLPCGDLFADAVIKRFLVGAVARAREPGCTMDWMPILSGPQSSGKTHFFEYLTPPRHDSPNQYPWCPIVQQGISYLKERPHALHGGWIVNLDEVERFFRRQYTEEFKNLVTVSTDRSRRLYENERLFPRSFVLVGCTNSANFMVDPTGNRRFMAISIHGVTPSPEDPDVMIVDLDRIKADRMRIWAAALQAYNDGHPREFSSYELKTIEEYLSGWRVDSPITESLRAVLDRNVSLLHQGKPAYKMSDIFRWLEIPLDPRNGGTNGITDELKRLGYECKRVKCAGHQMRVWIQSNPSPRPDGPGTASDWGSGY